MKRIYSFKPIEDSDAEVLILGSMPGQASLAAGQYYAHAQNAFWRIISELLHLDPGARYGTRVQALKSARIALWDVLHSCSREGSLDSRIEPGSHAANDFRVFFRAHPKISRVFFNGATAEAIFRRRVLRGLDGVSVSYARLPSTSPAHAGTPFTDKLAAWRVILLDQRRRTHERRATH